MNMLRVALLLSAVLAIGGSVVPSAVAGGWAVTTVDPIASGLTPGQSTTVGYTIRQHGVTPVNLDDTGLRIQPTDGSSVFYPGTRRGVVGHYVATITVPKRGATWTAQQGWFAPQDLGPMPIASVTGTVADGPGPQGLQWVLLGATILSASGLAWQLTRSRRRPVAPAG